MDEAISLKKEKFNNEATIVSMSLGGPSSPVLNSAVSSMKNAEILVIVAAGNSNYDACNFSPATSNDAFTVEISKNNISDTRSVYSNYGDCVYIFKPWTNIYSTVPGNKYDVFSGTSMATPIVSGFASAIAGSLRLTDPDEIREAVLKSFDGENKFDFLDN